jgi:photosystem II stability/assembly factor-like uncharacterized protein
MVFLLWTNAAQGQRRSGKQIFAGEPSKLSSPVDRSFLDQMLERGTRAPRSTAATSPLVNVQFLGPDNAASRTRAILNDRINPNLLFAGSTSGGLWKSMNGGTQWMPVDDFSTGMNITCIEQNPLNADVIYYGTGEYKNRKIRDTGSGIYRSTDHGNTFNQLPSTANTGFSLVYDMSHSRMDDSTIYVATAENGVYRSTNAGDDFQSVFFNGKAVSDVKCLHNGAVLITVSYDGIYLSTSGDSGTYVKSTGTPFNGFSRIEVAVCDSFPDIMYAILSDSVQSMTSGLAAMLKSIDGGLTWFAITNPENVGFFPYADYMLSIAVKPDNPDVVIVGGAQGCYSLDGGQSYIYLQYPYIDQHRYLFASNNPQVFYAGHDQGLSKFTFFNDTVTHTGLIEGYHTVQVWGGGFFPYGDDVFIGSQDNKFKLNRNGSATFQTLNNYGIDGKYCHIHQQQNNVAYAMGDFGNVMRSDNFLNNYPTLTPALSGLDNDGDGNVDDDVWYDCRLEMNYLNGDQLFLCTRDHVWRSANRGDTWSQVTNSYAGGNNSPHPYAIELSQSTAPDVYVGGTKGLFLRINDALNATVGSETNLSSFSPSVLFSTARIHDLKRHPTNSGVLYAGIRDPGISPRVWRIDGVDGNSPVWTDISGNLSQEHHVYSVEVDPNNPDSVIFIGTEYGLWFTEDGGNTWSRDNTIPPVTVYDIRLRTTDNRLFVFTFGRGVWSGNLTPVSAAPAVESVQEGWKIFPNPSAGHFQWMSLTGEEVLEVNVYSPTGAKVFSGSPSAKVDLKNLPDGLYVMEIKGSRTVFKQPIIKSTE